MTAPRMRTIQAAAALLREMDPDTDLTPYRLRAWVLDGTIPHVKAGAKRLINVDILLSKLDERICPPDDLQQIRRIG